MIRPKVELTKTRSISEVIDDSALFVKQNWKGLLKSYFTICGFFWIGSLLLSTFNQIRFRQLMDNGISAYDSVTLLSFVFEFLNLTVMTVTGLSYISLYRQKNNEVPTTAEVWDYVKYFFFRVLGANLLIGVMLTVGFLCCFFPGVYLWPVLSLVPVAIVLDNFSIRSAFSYGFELTSNKWGQVFGVLLLCMVLITAMWVLFLIPVGIVLALTTFARGSNAFGSNIVILNVVAHLIQFIYLFPLIALTLSYFNLVELREDRNLFDRIKMLGRNPKKVSADINNLEEEQY